MRDYNNVKKDCWVCGKTFNIRIRKEDGRILTNCFYSPMKINKFDWWAYEMLTNRDGDVFFRPKYKSWKYKVLAPNKIMRRFIYWVYNKLNKPNEYEYFECPTCNRREE